MFQAPQTLFTRHKAMYFRQPSTHVNTRRVLGLSR